MLAIPSPMWMSCRFTCLLRISRDESSDDGHDPIQETKIKEKRETEREVWPTWEPRIRAPSSRKRVKLLVRLKLPVTHVPLGTFSCDPPAPPNRRMWRTALRNVSVSGRPPSPTPPKSRSDITTSLAGGDPRKNPAQLPGPAGAPPASAGPGCWGATAGAGLVAIWNARTARKDSRRRRGGVHAGRARWAAADPSPEAGFPVSMLDRRRRRRRRRRRSHACRGRRRRRRTRKNATVRARQPKGHTKVKKEREGRDY